MRKVINLLIYLIRLERLYFHATDKILFNRLRIFSDLDYFLSIFVGGLKMNTKRWLIIDFLLEILAEFYQSRIFDQVLIDAFDQDFAVLERIGVY